MFKLFKYLKPFAGAMFLALLLLFVQAMCDLALPDYMSDIVNVGIQQNGIVSPLPTAVRESEYQKLSLFLSQEEQDAFARSYRLVSPQDDREDLSSLQKKYPLLKEEPIYLLDASSDTDKSLLTAAFPKPLLMVAGMESMKGQQQDGNIEINGQSLPADTDLFALLSSLPQEQRAQLLEQPTAQVDSMEPGIREKAAIGVLQEEYKAIGLSVKQIQSAYLWKMGLLMLAVSLAGAIAALLVTVIAARTAAGVSRVLRQKTFTRVENFSNAEFDRFSTASLITRTTNDINQVQMLVVLVVRFALYAPIMGVGGVIRALQNSPSMSWIIALAVLTLVVIVLVVYFVAFPKFKSIQKLVDRLNLITRESLSGMMVVRAFNTEQFEEKRFDEANQNLTRTNLFVSRIIVLMFPLMMLIMNFTTLLVVWVGADQIQSSQLQVGNMMAFIQYAMQIIMSFLILSMMFIMIPRASASAERVAEVLETEPTVKDPKQPKYLEENFDASVTFRNVSFRYPGAEECVLRNITFTARPGETTAFIGSTGSGKSTLVNLVPRFYDVTEGEILIGGVNIVKLPQQELRRQIGYVPQKGTLFTGTVSSNLKYGNEQAEESDLSQALDIAQAAHFVGRLPDGMESEISQGGKNVSGGQKQRLSIARALVKKPRIYIFDDSFSALDYKTDANLRRALSSQTQDATVLLVAQRISTIRNAQQIIVMNEGEIERIGTHEDLMRHSKTYQEIALSQLSKEELA